MDASDTFLGDRDNWGRYTLAGNNPTFGRIVRVFYGTVKILAAGTDLTGYVKDDGTGENGYAVINPASVDGKSSDAEGESEDSGKKFWLQTGAEAGDGIYLTFGRMDTNNLGIHGLEVSTETGATASIEKSKEALGKLNGIRSSIGASQNRLEHTIRHQENTTENTQQAESRIRDIDMASEMMNFSAANIIQQAVQSMLAQAYQLNQGVLSLLQ